MSVSYTHLKLAFYILAAAAVLLSAAQLILGGGIGAVVYPVSYTHLLEVVLHFLGDDLVAFAHQAVTNVLMGERYKIVSKEVQNYFRGQYLSLIHICVPPPASVVNTYRLKLFVNNSYLMYECPGSPFEIGRAHV